MHARVSKLEGLPEQVDELGRIATEWLAPALSEMEGFHAILALADRQSGKVELVTLWESEQAMHQSEQEAEQLRSATSRAAGGRRYRDRLRVVQRRLRQRDYRLARASTQRVWWRCRSQVSSGREASEKVMCGANRRVP
jgi:heme-degrading monooxygenase HmoA